MGGGGALLACVAAALAQRVWRRPDTASRLLLFCLAFAAAAAISTFWLAVFFPANMSPDSINQWRQAVYGGFTDWHPIGMTLVMRSIHLAFGGIPLRDQVAVIAWLQGTAFWGSIFALIASARLPLRTRTLICAGIALYFPIWPYTVTLWKDVWFGLALFWLVHCGYRVYLGKRSIWKLGWLLLPLLVFAQLNRHTAWLSFAFLAAAIAPILWAELGRRRCIANCLFSLVVLLAAMGIVKSLYKGLDVQYAGSAVNGLSLFEVVGTAHYAGITAPEWQSLRAASVLGNDRFHQLLERYRCGISIDYMVNDQGHPIELHELLNGDYAFHDFLTIAWRHPAAYLMHRGCSALHLLGVANSAVYLPFQVDIWNNEFGIEANSLLPGVRRAVVRLEWRGTRYLFLRWPFRHYLFLIASGLVSLFALRRREFPNRHLIYFLFIAGMSVLFPFLAITPASDWRYMMAGDVCWLCSVLIAAASWYYFRPGATLSAR